MKYLFVFLALGCSNAKTVTTQQLDNVVKTCGPLNCYEIVEIGPYVCVGSDGTYSGGVWCERKAPAHD